MAGVAKIQVRASKTAIAPFVKWAGGKRWLTQRYPELIPSGFATYFEPFFGSGSVFWSIQPDAGVVSDSNGELITTYTQIRDNWRRVQRLLEAHADKHSDTYYYIVRAQRITEPPAVAARFLYLNRTCWNGLYRVNTKGEFNVPRGTKNDIMLSSDDFEASALLLSGVEIVCADFEETIDKAVEGDFVFLDPPYTTAHNLNGFIKYNDRIFTWSDQVRLRNAVKKASDRGAKLLVTNANHESVRELYKGLGQQFQLDRATIISGTAKGRGATTELAIVVGYAPNDIVAGRLDSVRGLRADGSQSSIS